MNTTPPQPPTNVPFAARFSDDQRARLKSAMATLLKFQALKILEECQAKFDLLKAMEIKRLAESKPNDAGVQAPGNNTHSQ